MTVRPLTLVFFIRHLSHAFHTRLCLSLADVGECGSEWLVAALMMVVPPMRFDARCDDLEAFPEDDFLGGLWAWSSIGGVGMLCPIVVIVVISRGWDRGSWSIRCARGMRSCMSATCCEGERGTGRYIRTREAEAGVSGSKVRICISRMWVNVVESRTHREPLNPGTTGYI